MKCSIIKIELLFCFFAIFYKCSNERVVHPLKESTPVFTKQCMLEYDTLHTDYLLSYPVALYLTDSLLIIQDFRDKTSFFHVLDRESGKFKQEFGAIGRGPGELLSASYSSSFSLNKDTLYVFDDQAKKIVSYVNKGHTFGYYSEYVIPSAITQKGNIMNCFNINDRFWALGYNGIFNKNRFVVFNQNASSYRETGEYPNLSDYNITPTNMYQLFYGPSFIRINNSKTKAVFGTYKGGIMEVFDLSGIESGVLEKDTSLLFHAPYKLGESLESNSGITFGFEDLCITEHEIYALINGKTGEENPYFAKAVKVFDLKGNPIVEYLSDLNLRCIAVDVNNREFYAIAYEPNEIGFFLIRGVISHSL